MRVTVDVWDDDNSTREEVEMESLPAKGERVTVNGNEYVVYYAFENYLRVGNGA